MLLVLLIKCLHHLFPYRILFAALVLDLPPTVGVLRSPSIVVLNHHVAGVDS